MDAKPLPARPSLEQYKKQAKELLKAFRDEETLVSGDSQVAQRVTNYHPRFAKLAGDAIGSAKFALADAQLVIAREHGFESWPKFAAHVEALEVRTLASQVEDPVSAFLEAACVPRDGSSHSSGTLATAEAILTAHPGVASSSIYAASVLGSAMAVAALLAADPRNATVKDGPRGWDALTHLCFSRYLRLDHTRADDFVKAAKLLLDAGANPNTGWWEKNHQPKPEWESAIYGAAGVAQHPELTRLLLERGADPNDGETPYHVPETYDNATLRVLVESGKLTEDSLATILLRKTDWHDYKGVVWLLQRGVDPNHKTHWGKTALHNAVLSDNAIEIVDALLDHGADPTLIAERPDRSPAQSAPKSAIALAARRGRRDVLESIERHGFTIDLQGADRLVAACATNDGNTARAIASSDPQALRTLIDEGGDLLLWFVGVGNTDGMRQLLELGVGADAVSAQGDPYFDMARNSTALHSAAWRARPSTVKLLIERRAPLNARDGKNRTALMLAVKACVDSYWAERRTPECVEALLRAGASVEGVEFPCGYAEVDELLMAYGARERDPHSL